jgi:hypothetical protein
MLTDEEAEEIRQGLVLGMRGPILIGWCEKLLADRDARVARERAQRQPWPGPLAGPSVAAPSPLGYSRCDTDGA